MATATTELILKTNKATSDNKRPQAINNKKNTKNKIVGPLSGVIFHEL